MKPSKSAGRPSVLAINPRNLEASAARRARLLAAFNALDEDTRADLLEVAESWAFRATAAANTESYEARGIFRQMHAAMETRPDPDALSDRELACLATTAVELWEQIDEGDLSSYQQEVLAKARTIYYRQMAAGDPAGDAASYQDGPCGDR
jgi:hypothetical protein